MFADMQAEERIVRQSRASIEQGDVACCGQGSGQRLECIGGKANGISKRVARHTAGEGSIEQRLQVGASHAGVIGQVWRDGARRWHKCAIQLAKP
jgi:hypothetical protein